MNDEDIAKLAAKLGEVIASKEDLNVGLNKVETKIEEVNQKADLILKYADGIDDSVTDHEKRLKAIESVSVVAHELRAKN